MLHREQGKPERRTRLRGGPVAWTPVSLTIGIVGLPNVGKSTLFNALTKNDVLAANYPFATIEPNVGVVGLPDPRLTRLAEVFDSQKIVPAPVSFVDIAGLVRGASKGAGRAGRGRLHGRQGRVGADRAARGRGARAAAVDRAVRARSAPAHPRRLPHARAADLPDGRAEGGAGLDDPGRRHRAGGRRRD